MLRAVSGLHWAGPHGGTREPAAAAQVVPPAPPPGWAPSDVHGGKVREAPAQGGLWGSSGTFKSPARGGVGRRKGPARRGGLFPLNLAVLGAGQAACVCKLPGAPGGTQRSFLVCLGSRGPELM